MKRVYTTSDQVLHLWANQSQSDARCKNVFFEGPSVYSYGYHYELGRLIQVKGQTVALINDRGYSVTTSKHIGQAFVATTHLPTLSSTDLNNPFVGLLENQEELISQIFGIFCQRRFWSDHIRYTIPPLKNDIKTFNGLCDLFDHKELKIDLNEDLLNLIRAHVKVSLKKQTLRDKEKQAKLLEQAKLDLEAWRSGGPLTNALRALDPQIIRIKGDLVETSRGAQVPLAAAKRLLVKILNSNKVAGETIGSFTVTKCLGDTIKIGCHTLSISAAQTILGQGE